MFGYISCDESLLSVHDRNTITAFYCGLCFCLKNNYGNKARLFTNIDCTYALMLIASISQTEIELDKKRCMLHPFSKKNVAFFGDELGRKISSATILISYYKLLDDCKDEKKNLTKKTMRSFYKNIAKKAMEILPEFDKSLNELSLQTQKLESENANELFTLMDISGNILKQMAISCDAEPLAELFFQMGRLIYFLDALDDYQDDLKKKRFNALALHCGNFETKKKLALEKNDEIQKIFDEISSKLQNEYANFCPENDSNPIFDNLFSAGIKKAFHKAFSEK